MHTVQRHDLQEPHGHQCLLQFVPRAPSGRSEYTPPCHLRDAGDESPTSTAIEKSGNTATTQVIDMTGSSRGAPASAPGRRFVATALRKPAVKLSQRLQRDGGNSEKSFVHVRRHNIGKTASSQRSVEKYHDSKVFFRIKHRHAAVPAGSAIVPIGAVVEIPCQSYFELRASIG